MYWAPYFVSMDSTGKVSLNTSFFPFPGLLNDIDIGLHHEWSCPLCGPCSPVSFTWFCVSCYPIRSLRGNVLLIHPEQYPTHNSFSVNVSSTVCAGDIKSYRRLSPCLLKFHNLEGGKKHDWQNKWLPIIPIMVLTIERAIIPWAIVF